MHRRTRNTLWIVVAVLVVLAAAIFLRSKAPPEAARLLPESDGIVYVNFRPLRALVHKQVKPPVRVPDYQQFVDATGIDWERDLEEAAVALHRMPDPNGPNGPVAYSMVLEGKVNGKRFNEWLEANATSRESYAGHTVFSIPSNGRTVRVARIGYDMVAVSNWPDTEKIHSMLDRHRTAALPFAGSTLLAQYYRDVPLLAFAWGVGEIARPFSESGAIQIFGFQLPLNPDSTIIASLAPVISAKGVLRLRVEEIATSEQIAAQQAAALTSLIALARGFTPGLADNAANDSLKQLLKSAEITTKNNRVLASATVSPKLLGGLASDAGAAQAQK